MVAEGMHRMGFVSQLSQHRKPVSAGTKLRVMLDGQELIVVVVEDLGDIGVNGRRLVRVRPAFSSEDEDDVFDLPLELTREVEPA